MKMRTRGAKFQSIGKLSSQLAKHTSFRGNAPGLDMFEMAGLQNEKNA
jgi:hypothetical protein